MTLQLVAMVPPDVRRDLVRKGRFVVRAARAPAVFLFGLASACNAILGIEEVRLHDGGSVGSQDAVVTDGPDDTPRVEVRFVHLVPPQFGTFSYEVLGTGLSVDLEFGESTDYYPIEPGVRDAIMGPAGTTTIMLRRDGVDMVDGSRWSIIGYGNPANGPPDFPEELLVDDERSLSLEPGESGVRFRDTHYEHTGLLDVYRDEVSEQARLFDGIAFGLGYAGKLTDPGSARLLLDVGQDGIADVAYNVTLSDQENASLIWAYDGGGATYLLKLGADGPAETYDPMVP